MVKQAPIARQTMKENIMAFATSDFSPVRSEPRGNIFRRMFNALVESRMREAERMVATHLSALDDKTLEELGYDRARLAATPSRYRF